MALGVVALGGAALLAVALGAGAPEGGRELRADQAVELARLCVSVNERATGSAVEGWVDGAGPDDHRFAYLAFERQGIVVPGVDRFTAVCRLGS